MNDPLHNKRHSLAHLLASAVLELYPDAKLGIGPTIDTGFYYDFLLPEPLAPEDLPKLEKRMKHLIKQGLTFTREDKSTTEAKQFFSDRSQPFKVELIEDIKKFGSTKLNEQSYSTTGSNEEATSRDSVSIYTTGNFIDLCRGGHVDNTKELDPDSFKLDKISGAYWRGDENNQMLTRIYGLAFDTKTELDAHVAMIEEAQKRDHKKLGPQLDLFVFSDLVGPGLPLWTPKGTIVRHLLDNFVWELRKEKKYDRVEIPHITKKELYEKSGHWDKFKDELFRITTREGHEFAMKPMNCPHHTQIYNRKRWSYRDLPQRYANTTTCYRDEQSGELSGLSRVRAFAQDDAHVFARLSQVKEELKSIWDIVERFYKPFGFELKVRLSMHDPANPENYLGDPENWKKSESILRELASEQHAETFDGIGEAAFYGPKLDFITKDSLGREWQVATIQLDMNMPERFDLFCINEAAQEERIVMIHAAIMGSLERFLSILIEHTAGNFPVWLSPIQAMILPISDKHAEYGQSVMQQITGTIPNARIEMDIRSESVGKRIRESVTQKIPYLLVVGDKEIESNSVSVRGRGDIDLGSIPINEYVEKLQQEIESRS